MYWTWCLKSPCTSRYTDDDAVLVHEAPLNERMHCSQCDILRVKNASGLSPSAVRDTLHKALGGGHAWVGGLFVDGTDLVVSVILHSIRFFQHLRNAVVLDTFTPVLQKELGDAVTLDKSLFARQYVSRTMWPYLGYTLTHSMIPNQATTSKNISHSSLSHVLFVQATILMEFDELTPHQRAKMASWGTSKRVNVRGPAGKTRAVTLTLMPSDAHAHLLCSDVMSQTV